MRRRRFLKTLASAVVLGFTNCVGFPHQSPRTPRGLPRGLWIPVRQVTLAELREQCAWDRRTWTPRWELA